MTASILDRFVHACDYPGALDVAAVESALQRYVDALGVKPRIQRLESGWDVRDHPSILRAVIEILGQAGIRRAARAALAALAARADLRSALASLQRFAAWCTQSGWWWDWDLSWLACYYPGAVQLDKKLVLPWSEAVYDAFLAGGWILFWTDDTLFWASKPRVHTEKVQSSGVSVRRLHNPDYAAVESDVENVYFWHGVLVPAFVVTRPDWITLDHISAENNAEVRRVFIERYGLSRYLVDSGARRISEDEFGELYRTEIPGDEPLVMVKVMNSTAEPDGSFKPYFLRVHPEMRPLLVDGTLGDPQPVRPLNAIASTFGMRGQDYVKRLVDQS